MSIALANQCGCFTSNQPMTGLHFILLPSNQT